MLSTVWLAVLACAPGLAGSEEFSHMLERSEEGASVVLTLSAPAMNHPTHSGLIEVSLLLTQKPDLVRTPKEWRYKVVPDSRCGWIILWRRRAAKRSAGIVEGFGAVVTGASPVQWCRYSARFANDVVLEVLPDASIP
jgi:hypothetical protein